MGSVFDWLFGAGQQQSKKDIQDANKAGKPFDASQMDSAHQEALHTLIKQDHPAGTTQDQALDDEVKRRKILGQPNYK
jgi:hypothetical protein